MESTSAERDVLSELTLGQGASAEEVDAMARWNWGAHGPTEAEVEASRAALVSWGESQVLLVGRIGGKPVGFVRLQRSCLGRSDTWLLDQVTVEEGMRRRGVATHMLRVALREHVRASRVLSMLQPDNTASLALHMKVNFVVAGSLYLRDGDLRVLLLHHRDCEYE
eukprot:TRINITY_DN7527_c0_g2_i1.p3 TRINITY_DN7527_c0_g2~~TRINITY_DN7527_c0_g2_i1.p3  ORF type:complete len:166 (-),score=52.44 TRINITY_DN7527_c0_g2_i1:953-1450(-)